MTLTAYETVRLLAGFAMVLLLLPAVPAFHRWRRPLRAAALAAFVVAMLAALYAWLAGKG